MKIDKDTLLEFKRITSKDILGFLTLVKEFFLTDYNVIVSYFSGNVDTIDSVRFEKLSRINEQLLVMFDTYHYNSQQLVGTRWWSLLEILEDIDSQLNTIKNLPRWSRSSITNFNYSSVNQLDYILKQNETLEKVATEVLSQSTDQWVKIAFDNSLREEDYTKDTNNELKLFFNETSQPFTLNSVVDTISGKSVFGKDFVDYISFEDEDLKSLDYDETLQQSVSILSNLKKNDNPDFPNDGVQSSIVAGGNRATFNFPILTRQLQQTFSTDDTLKDFQILLLSIEEDKLFLEYQVSSRLGEVELTSNITF